MRKRRLGKTDWQISEIGFGAWPIGGIMYGDVPTEDAGAAIRAYVEAGGNFIDTARVYRTSEEIIGRTIYQCARREDLIIASKTKALDAAGIETDLAETLRHLQTDYVDLYYIHEPPEDADAAHEVLEVFQSLKKRGFIRAVGASIKGPNVTSATVDLCRQYMATGCVDALQVIYSIFRQKIREIMNEALKNDVGIVARGILESGFLTGKYKPGHLFVEGDHRNRWGRRGLDHCLQCVNELKEFAASRQIENLNHLSIQFALRPKAVSTVILGGKTEQQVMENLDTLQSPPLDADLLEQLAELYGGRTSEFNIPESA